MYRLFGFLLMGMTLFAEKISVELSAQSGLIPATLLPIEHGEDGAIGIYERKLEKAFRFDLHFSGKMLLVDPKSHVKLRVSAVGDGYPAASNETSTPQISLRPTVRGGTITLACSRFGQTKTYSAPLTGIFARDKARIHQICDKLHEVLFNAKGIASRKIAYTLKMKDPSHPKGYRAEIWESDWDGSHAHRISSAKDFSLTPVYWPGQQKLLYVNYRTGLSKIHVLDLKQKTSRPFLSVRGNQMLPTISRDGSFVAFISDAAGASDLFVVDLRRGRKPTRFSHARGATHASPTFSPKTSQIAFVSDFTGQPQIYVATLDLTHRASPVRLTEKNRQNTCPAWSPDGTKLVYVGLTDGVRQLWIYDFKTKSEKQLTFDPINKECPTWAPSSEHIAYNTAEGAEIFLLSLNLGESVRISREGGEKKFPTWQP